MYMKPGEPFDGLDGRRYPAEPQEIDYADIRLAHRAGWQPCDLPPVAEPSEATG